MSNVDHIFDILIYLAAGIFVAGWICIIIDALSGFRIFERLPRLAASLGTVQKGVWILLAVVFVLIVFGRGWPMVRYDPDCRVLQTRDGQEVVC
jgi:hypothetical protein